MNEWIQIHFKHFLIQREDVIFKPVHRHIHTFIQEEVHAAYPTLRIGWRGLAVGRMGAHCGPHLAHAGVWAHYSIKREILNEHDSSTFTWLSCFSWKLNIFLKCISWKYCIYKQVFSNTFLKLQTLDLRKEGNGYLNKSIIWEIEDSFYVVWVSK